MVHEKKHSPCRTARVFFQQLRRRAYLIIAAWNDIFRLHGLRGAVREDSVTGPDILEHGFGRVGSNLLATKLFDRSEKPRLQFDSLASDHMMSWDANVVIIIAESAPLRMPHWRSRQSHARVRPNITALPNSLESIAVRRKLEGLLCRARINARCGTKFEEWRPLRAYTSSFRGVTHGYRQRSVSGFNLVPAARLGEF